MTPSNPLCLPKKLISKHVPLKSEHEIYRPTRGLNPAPPADRSGRCALCLSSLSHRGRLFISSSTQSQQVFLWCPLCLVFCFLFHQPPSSYNIYPSRHHPYIQHVQTISTNLSWLKNDNISHNWRTFYLLISMKIHSPLI